MSVVVSILVPEPTLVVLNTIAIVTAPKLCIYAIGLIVNCDVADAENLTAPKPF